MGQTTQNIPCFDVFDFVDRDGFPLALAIQVFHDRGLMISWGTFLGRAHASGWNLKRKIPEIRMDLAAAYGREWAVEWERRALLFAASLTSPASA